MHQFGNQVFGWSFFLFSFFLQFLCSQNFWVFQFWHHGANLQTKCQKRTYQFKASIIWSILYEKYPKMITKCKGTNSFSWKKNSELINLGFVVGCHEKHDYFRHKCVAMQVLNESRAFFSIHDISRACTAVLAWLLLVWLCCQKGANCQTKREPNQGAETPLLFVTF